MRHVELVQGELLAMSPTGGEHGLLCARIIARLQFYADEQDAGVVLSSETGFLLERNPDTVRAPDASFIRKEHLAERPILRTFVPGAPDLAVEVISPGDSASQVQQKVQSWRAHGVQLVWVVEPNTQTVTVYRGDGTLSMLHRTDTLDGESVLPGFTYPLARLFR